tara:strand:- start:66 stop:593 length:528 start_codon:yes stop_codon:yes gene_type:complete
MKILILYSSIDGHTKKICSFISNKLKQNHIIEMNEINNDENVKFDIYDFIIIGASIRYGTYRKSFLKFINENHIELQNSKSAFFSVNIVARKKEKNSINTNPYIKKFFRLSKWKPNIVEVFAGKLDYPKYNFFNKNIIKFIMWITNGPTQTDIVVEFTNWNDVKKFANKINYLEI